MDETDSNLVSKKQTKDNIQAVEIDMAKLNEMSRKDLYDLARKFEIANYSKMTKNELKFAILRKQTESIGYFFYEGILEILPDGYGFLRSIDNHCYQDLMMCMCHSLRLKSLTYLLAI